MFDKFHQGDIVTGRHFPANEEEDDSLDADGNQISDGVRNERMNITAISKNLRVRKPINYNEDRN